MSTETAKDHDVIDTMTAWRFWHIPARKGPPVTELRAVSPKDQTHWDGNVMHAVCRRDSAHTPPHPGCTCGIYAMNAADIQFVSDIHYWLCQEWDWLAKNGLHQGVTPLASGQGDRGHPDLRREARKYQQHDVVIGRVQIRHARLYERPQDKLGQPTCWRARKATLESLYLPDRVTRDPGPICTKLSARYGVPCEVGYPRITQHEWDCRTPTEVLRPHLLRGYSGDLRRLPPGTAAPTPPRQRFWVETLPPRPARRDRKRPPTTRTRT